MSFLKIILYVENIFCIYRNYAFCSKSTQRLILLRVAFEATLIIYFIYLTFPKSFTYVYFTLNFLNSLVIIICAIFHARHFKKLIIYFKSVNLFFPDSNELTKKSKNLQIILISYCVIYSLIRIGVSVFYVRYDLFFYISLTIQTTLSDQRFLIESCVVCCAVNAVADQLSIIERVIEKESFGIDEYTGEVMAACEHAARDVIISRDCKQRLRMFDTWSAAYASVRKCSELCNYIFGFQITLMLTTVSIYYIILIYVIISMTIQGKFTMHMKFMYLLSLGEYMVVLYLVSRAAQRALNNSVTLKRRLAILLIHSIDCEKQYKATRDMLRQVSTLPIQTKAFGSIAVSVSLLPTCLALCVSYVVVALQFNNII